MTVGELIRSLSVFNPDTNVHIDVDEDQASIVQNIRIQRGREPTEHSNEIKPYIVLCNYNTF